MGMMGAVLFDLDDTLIDSARGRAVAEARVSGMLVDYLRGLGVTVEGADLLRDLSFLGRRMNQQYLYDRSIWWQAFITNLGLGVTLPRSMVSDITNEYWSIYGRWALVYPDTVGTLEALLAKGFRLGMVTDTDGTPDVKMWRISLLSFKRAFSIIIVAGEDTEETKPSVTPFRLAALRMGLSCSECIFVGDKPFTDIRGAKKAGMKTILVERGIWKLGEEPDFTVASLSELCQIL